MAVDFVCVRPFQAEMVVNVFLMVGRFILTGRTCVTRQCESHGSVQQAAAE